jgi:hypothetical protein
VAAGLSERLGLRLVLAHVVEGIASLDGDESVTTTGSHEGAARLVARLAAEHGLATGPSSARASATRRRCSAGSPPRRRPT